MEDAVLIDQLEKQIKKNGYLHDLQLFIDANEDESGLVAFWQSARLHILITIKQPRFKREPGSQGQTEEARSGE